MIDEYDQLFRQAAEKYLPDHDWRLLKAQGWQESRFDPEAESESGARGIMQFMRNTWREWAPRAGFGAVSYPREDPEASIYTGAYYMAYLINEWSWPRPWIDRYCLALASYNAGLGHILEAQEQQGSPSLYAEIIAGLPYVTNQIKAGQAIDYVDKVLNFWIEEVMG